MAVVGPRATPLAAYPAQSARLVVPGPGSRTPPPTPFPGWLRLGTAGQPAAARIVPGTELSIRRILSGRVEVELFECGRLCCALGNTG